MADSALVAYRATILGFLMTCTIKNSWLADTVNQQLILRGIDVDLSEPTLWKYYMNLAGDYHPSDTAMTVLSLDTQAEISFTKELLAVHPRTRLAYRPGTEEYTQLCELYPDQTDLIRNIVYPVTDIEAAITAGDFTLLRWGAGYLEDAETQPLVNDMIQFLEYVSNRWYFDWLEHEDYYRPTFWACLWQHLTALLHASRIKNLHTAHVHTFHVWEYLKSQGLGDYSDVLTRRQAMFLYRNMRHIRRNRGRQENLILLVNRLLTEQSIAMMSKVIWHEMPDDEGDLIWQPEFISDPIETDYVRSLRTPPPQTVQEIVIKLHEIGADYDTSSDYINRVTRRLSATRSNRLITKLLEIQPILQDRKYAPMLNGFILDNLVHAVNSGQYGIQITYQDPNTGIILRLTPRCTLALIYYAIWRTKGEIAINLPTTYLPLVGTFRSDLTVDTFPATITHRGNMYSVSSVVDIASFIAGGQPPSSNYITVEEFAETIGQMFVTLVTMQRTIQHVGTLAHVSVLKTLRRMSLDREAFDIELNAVGTYAEWFELPSRLDAAAVVEAIELLDDPSTAYHTLIDGLLEQLVPPSHPSLAKWLDNASSSGLFGRMKELFVQLCSYNVLFLDTGRDRQNWVLLPRTLIDIVDSTVTQSGHTDGTINLTRNGEQHIQHDVYRMSDPPGRAAHAYYQDVVETHLGSELLEGVVTVSETRPAITGIWAQASVPTFSETVHANFGFSIINQTQDE